MRNGNFIVWELHSDTFGVTIGSERDIRVTPPSWFGLEKGMLLLRPYQARELIHSLKKALRALRKIEWMEGNGSFFTELIEPETSEKTVPAWLHQGVSEPD